MLAAVGFAHLVAKGPIVYALVEETLQNWAALGLLTLRMMVWPDPKKHTTPHEQPC